MNRYIDADQLAEELKKPVDVDNADELWEGWHACTIAVDEAIRRTPAADVRENVRAVWIEQELQSLLGRRRTETRCGNCGFEVYRKTRFCPNCGADMRGEV